ncbi:MAG TPA: permease [Kiritimatiellia bacterium]|nr:permease [Kiritimatiellia bacterium]
MNRELKIFLGLLAGFLAAYFMPIESARLQGALIEALRLVKWYAQEHVLLCLVPAFFIAGAIGVFISQNAVMKYFGHKANKLLAYGVASVSGTILAVCSCTVLPLFGGIYMRGAGLGPAVAFLYSGPAINVLAIVMSARILGYQIGLARAIGAVLFSVVIGALMHLIFLKDERAKAAQATDVYIEPDDRPPRPLWQTALHFLSMAAVLVFANWARPADPSGVWHAIFVAKWGLTAGFAVMTGFCLWRFFGVPAIRIALAAATIAALAWIFPQQPVIAFTAGFAALALLTFRSTPEMREWRDQTWGFAKQITPLLLGGVLAAGFFLGTPESSDAGIVPNRWIQALVGDDPSVFFGILGGSGDVPGWLGAIWPVWTNFFASLVGALMYFATLTEIPIVRGLMDSGMGQGPALALLLAGPALSLPNMLVINSILGPKKTLTFVALVVLMATLSGLIFGTWIAT